MTPPDRQTPPHPHLWPATAALSAEGRLHVGGCDLAELARTYGTPLYVYDEATIRGQLRAFQSAIGARYPNYAVAYAAKAYLAPSLAAILREERCALDAVSLGEVGMALAGGIAPEAIHLHGNFKPRAELQAALAAGVGRVVVESLEELDEVAAIAQAGGMRQRIWLRLRPDVATDTHPHDQTGHAGSKFGLDLATDAPEAARRARASPHLELAGLHAHAGSNLRDSAPIAAVTRVLVDFAAALREAHGVTIAEISPGGGWGVAYHCDEPEPPIADYAAALVGAMTAGLARHALPPPRLIVEPGRAIVARAGIALYTAGPRKRAPDGTVTLAVDGGMGDNPRPALYGARYHAALPARMADAPAATTRIVGRYCESGDVLVAAVPLPATAPGETVAVPVSGAYQLAMASNYNLVPRPAVVFVRDGAARLVRRRETLADLLAAEAMPPA
ncbi:MAG TPA: diaminopimelate decarboxylase [Ktedonobacterales bacterium]|nr:diaminopimelate decarboxylase [Ktedonobacterales bacterium]